MKWRRPVPYWTGTVRTDGLNCFSQHSGVLFIFIGMRGGCKIIQIERQELLASLASKINALRSSSRDGP